MTCGRACCRWGIVGGLGSTGAEELRLGTTIRQQRNSACEGEGGGGNGMQKLRVSSKAASSNAHKALRRTGRGSDVPSHMRTWVAIILAA